MFIECLLKKKEKKAALDMYRMFDLRAAIVNVQNTFYHSCLSKTRQRKFQTHQGRALSCQKLMGQMYCCCSPWLHTTVIFVCLCMCVCPSQAIPRKLKMHHVLIILTLTFNQSHIDLGHESNQCLVISESIQAMPIKFAVKLVQLKVYVTIAKCVSNLTTF